MIDPLSMKIVFKDFAFKKEKRFWKKVALQVPENLVSDLT